ncbi:hypothetical protein D5086_010769 [Populus alba]|uniref:Uncharacterized protein n=1 Tax=Populus alba TaxID=43335 RepID=A0ACC4CB29_POPAL
MAPESVNDNAYESGVDIWALGCAVIEMLTGKPAWSCKPGTNMFVLLIRIGKGKGTAPSGEEIEVSSTSPTCHFDFPDWVSIQSPSPRSEFLSDDGVGLVFPSLNSSSWISAADRIRQLASDQCCNWSDSGFWVALRIREASRKLFSKIYLDGHRRRDPMAFVRNSGGNFSPNPKTEATQKETKYSS